MEYVEVVIDGARPANKLDCLLDRERQKIGYCRALFAASPKKGRGDGKILPIPAKAIFIDWLRANSITFQVCGIDGDVRIAQRAKDLRGIVLARDSDFFIFDTVGYIAFPSIEDPGSNRRVFSGRLFEQHRLSSLLQISSELLPLFACLCGNDFVPLTVTQRVKDFLLRKSETFSGRGSSKFRPFFRRADYLKSLPSDDLELVLEKVKTDLWNGHNKEAKSKLTFAVAQYSISVTRLQDKDGLIVVPADVMSRIEGGLLWSEVLNIFMHKELVLFQPVESLETLSAWTPALPLLRTLTSLLGLAHPSTEISGVKIHHRVGHSLAQQVLLPTGTSEDISRTCVAAYADRPEQRSIFTALLKLDTEMWDCLPLNVHFGIAAVAFLASQIHLNEKDRLSLCYHVFSCENNTDSPPVTQNPEISPQKLHAHLISQWHAVVLMMRSIVEWVCRSSQPITALLDGHHIHVAFRVTADHKRSDLLHQALKLVNYVAPLDLTKDQPGGNKPRPLTAKRSKKREPVKSKSSLRSNPFAALANM